MLSLISTIASVIETDFADYYNNFMPLMTEVLTKVPQETMAQKKLRAKAIETIGGMIIAVSQSEQADSFEAGVIEVTTFLAQILASKLPNDDPQDEAIKETLTQCAGFLGEKFAQFMPILLDQLVADAQLDLDFKMENADMPSTTENMAFVQKVKGFGEQRISMNTEALVKKTSAFGLLE